MPDLSDASEQFDIAVSEVMEQFIAEVVADVKQELSVPWPPSSVPGEKPHLRTGRLQSEVEGSVRNYPSQIIGEVGSGAPYSYYLEYNLDRSFLGPALDKWGPIFEQRLREAFEGYR